MLQCSMKQYKNDDVCELSFLDVSIIAFHENDIVYTDILSS